MEKVAAYLGRNLTCAEDRKTCLQYIRGAGLSRQQVIWAEEMLARWISARLFARGVAGSALVPSRGVAGVVDFLREHLMCAEDGPRCLEHIHGAGLCAAHEWQMEELLAHWIFIGHFGPHEEGSGVGGRSDWGGCGRGCRDGVERDGEVGDARRGDGDAVAGVGHPGEDHEGDEPPEDAQGEDGVLVHGIARGAGALFNTAAEADQSMRRAA
jgi:hypothetical protein